MQGHVPRLQKSRPYLPDFQAVLEDGIHSIRFFLCPLQHVRVILGLLLAQGRVGSVIVKLGAVSFCWREKRRERKTKEQDQVVHKLQRCDGSRTALLGQLFHLILIRWTPLLSRLVHWHALIFSVSPLLSQPKLQGGLGVMKHQWGLTDTREGGNNFSSPAGTRSNLSLLLCSLD